MDYVLTLVMFFIFNIYAKQSVLLFIEKNHRIKHFISLFKWHETNNLSLKDSYEQFSVNEDFLMVRKTLKILLK